MNFGPIQLSVQRQLKDDWDNREYIQLISDNIKNIADFLTNFGLFHIIFIVIIIFLFQKFLAKENLLNWTIKSPPLNGNLII